MLQFYCFLGLKDACYCVARFIKYFERKRAHCASLEKIASLSAIQFLCSMLLERFNEIIHDLLLARFNQVRSI
jgi:hypothetical protein